MAGNATDFRKYLKGPSCAAYDAALPGACCHPTIGEAGTAVAGENGSSDSLIIPLSHNLEE